MSGIVLNDAGNFALDKMASNSRTSSPRTDPIFRRLIAALSEPTGLFFFFPFLSLSSPTRRAFVVGQAQRRGHERDVEAQAVEGT